MATVKSSLSSADLRADQDSGLDPLVFLAPPILEPDPDDPRVQAGHLHQLLLSEAEAEVSVTKCIQGPENKRKGVLYYKPIPIASAEDTLLLCILPSFGVDINLE